MDVIVYNQVRGHAVCEMLGTGEGALYYAPVVPNGPSIWEYADCYPVVPEVAVFMYGEERDVALKP